jgi:hypothetical protein
LRSPLATETKVLSNVHFCQKIDLCLYLSTLLLPPKHGKDAPCRRLPNDFIVTQNLAENKQIGKIALQMLLSVRYGYDKII